KKRCEELDKQIEVKKEELEMLAKHNKLEYENKLLELELELQQINKEKEYYQREQKKLMEIEEKKKRLTSQEREWEETLAGVDEEIKEQFEEKEELKNEVMEETNQKGLKMTNDEKQTETSKRNVCDIARHEHYEKFDYANILEVKHITLTNKDTGYNEFYNISFNVKKSGVTVVYSKSQRLLQGLEMAIMRTLPSNMCLTEGQIRFNAEDIGEVLRSDYRKRVRNLIISLTDTEDKLSRSSKKYSSALKGYEIDTQKLNKSLELLELDKSLKNRKLSKMKAEEKEKFAMAILFSMDIDLKILYEPQEDIGDEKKDVLISLISQNKPNTAQLILTSDQTLAVNLDDCSLYSL
ncbi:MAG: hypothetical protein ACOCWI_04095, partial [Bacillota bacterium]